VEPAKKVFSELKKEITENGRIIYKIDKNVVNVLLIVDSRRNVQDVLLERLLT
jgi:hypothetical protein